MECGVCDCVCVWMIFVFLIWFLIQKNAQMDWRTHHNNYVLLETLKGDFVCMSVWVLNNNNTWYIYICMCL